MPAANAPIPQANLSTFISPHHKPGDTIGHFRILETLGEGGFGVVYLAEQLHPVRRRVALKIIKPGMDSKAVLARFDAERQALALMNHPNIAKVLDAGTTPLTDPATGKDSPGGGRPYFAMEHIKGEPITGYCDKHRLTVTQRLKLFATVCEAVQHAHTKAIIHRDLKPSNILVASGEGNTPRPVIIDFGVAKALAGRLSDATIFTAFTAQGQLLGTPEYMSPEQAEMSEADIDTRSDVYALGVVLYELLTGTVPFDSATLRSAGRAAIEKLLREVEPPRPSTKLSSAGEANTAIAAARHIALDDLTKQLRNELEWIPLKALRKDRNDRYRSASELADDVNNYLTHQPLLAGPESTAYKVRKFARRNKGFIAAASAIAGTLLLATVVSVTFGIQAQRARVEAETQRDRAVASEAETKKQTALAEATAQREREERTRADDAQAFNMCGEFSDGLHYVTLRAVPTTAALRHISRYPTATTLQLDKWIRGAGDGMNGVDEALAVLAAKDSPRTALTHLYLQGRKVTDQGLARVAAKDSPLSDLGSLSLGYTQVTDQGIAALVAKDSSLTALITLDLDGTKITDQALAALASRDSPLNALTWLELNSTNITDQGLASLAAKESSLTALTELYLGNTQITDRGLAVLIANDSRLTALTMLDLRETQVTDAGIAALKQRFPNITIWK